MEIDFWKCVSLHLRAHLACTSLTGPVAESFVSNEAFNGAFSCGSGHGAWCSGGCGGSYRKRSVSHGTRHGGIYVATDGIAVEAVSWCRGIQIMVGVTSALAFLHDRRVVHRDVKPDPG